MKTDVIAGLRRTTIGVGTAVVLVILVALIIAMRPAATTTLAQAAPAGTPQPAQQSDEPAAGVPSDVQSELARLPKGTVIVDCMPGVPLMPEGITPSRAAGWFQLHPGFRQLSHGYCVDNPSAVVTEIREDRVDP